jgi:GTP cyclohydrolase I
MRKPFQTFKNGTTSHWGVYDQRIKLTEIQKHLRGFMDSVNRDDYIKFLKDPEKFQKAYEEYVKRIKEADEEQSINEKSSSQLSKEDDPSGDH